MAIREDIKMLLAKKSITMTKLAQELSTSEHKVTVQSISKKLSKGTIQFEEVRTILDVLGYDIEFKQRN